MDAEQVIQKVNCPKCGARRGWRCVVPPPGRTREDPHPERVQAAREMQVAEQAADEEAERVADETECQGHPPGPFDPMGETVFCDGSCRLPARTTFDEAEQQRRDDRFAEERARA